MADDCELEKRAVEELLRETNRARVRAETMGPTGWMKCPLRSTNKRFLLNTLRSTGLHHGNAGENSTTRGRPSASESRSRHRSRSRTPPRDHERYGDHRGGHKSHSNNHNNRPDRDMDSRDCHKDRGSRDQRHRKGDRKRDDEKFRLQSKDRSLREGHTSSLNQSLSKE